VGWLTEWRRKRVLAKHAIDDRLWSSATGRLEFLPSSPKLRELALLFLAEKQFVGAQGLEVTDRMRVSIAAQACLPVLELGLGISYQDAPPMYLMDGAAQIMISKALNESDRLSSCSRGARKHLDGLDSLFNVYSFQTFEAPSADFTSDEFIIRFNVGGININEAAFQKLRQEISLSSIDRTLHTLWDTELVRLYSGLVPLGGGVFRRIVVRQGKIARIDPSDFAFKGWTDQNYYEVCTHPSIYEYVESQTSAQAATAD
jgi:hypothetical protein